MNSIIKAIISLLAIAGAEGIIAFSVPPRAVLCHIPILTTKGLIGVDDDGHLLRPVALHYYWYWFL